MSIPRDEREAELSTIDSMLLHPRRAERGAAASPFRGRTRRLSAAHSVLRAQHLLLTVRSVLPI